MHYLNSPERFLRSVSLCFNICTAEFYRLFIIALKDVCFLEKAHYSYENIQLGYFYKKLSLWGLWQDLRTACSVVENRAPYKPFVWVSTTG